MDPFVGEIKIFAGSFAPRGWGFCDGSLLAIRSNTALYSLLGAYYGGDGVNTFALPDLRGKAPIQQGQGPGLSSYQLGQTSGTSSVTLNTSNLPAHVHTLVATSDVADQFAAGGQQLATATTGGRPPSSGNIYSTNGVSTTMSPQSIGPTGNTQAHNNMMPYQGIYYIIALTGVYPIRP